MNNTVKVQRYGRSTLQKQTQGIVGFKVKVQEFQAAFKLSQNRNEVDYTNIIDKLNKETDLNSRQLAEVMKARKTK